MALATGAWRDSRARSARSAGFELGEQRCGPLGPDREPPLGAQSIDLPLDVEQGVDPRHGLKGQRRDDGARLALLRPPLRRGGDVGQDKELAPRMGPAERLGDRPRRAAKRIQPVVPGIGIGLQDPGKAGQVLLGMRAGSIARVIEQRRRRIGASRGCIVAHIDPGPRRVGLALRQHRHRGVVAMNALGGQHMGRDQVVERSQHGGTGAHLVGQGRQALSSTPSRP